MNSTGATTAASPTVERIEARGGAPGGSHTSTSSKLTPFTDNFIAVDPDGNPVLVDQHV